MVRKMLVAPVVACLLAAPVANAHIVGLGYTFVGDDIVFDAMHWHGNHPVAGFLSVNGQEHAFTSYTWDTTSMVGLDGGLVNSSYSTFDETTGTLSATGAQSSFSGDGIVNDWLHVIVPNPGTETITLSTVYGPGGLTSWILDDQIIEFDIAQPEPEPDTRPIASVPEPATLGLLGLGLLGMAGVGRGRRFTASD